MNVLDLQEMDTPEYLDGDGGGHGGHGGSQLSLLLCDSAASVIACL
ncbi:MAG TPA: SapB/AmfS family lanthipeptide [Pseudonocardiaceae bacterium]|nr:SapB/AmfS family lanthipeptide [Pseudonocardiaceae bacterium]